MRAALVHQFHQPLRIEDVPVPVPGHGEVLVKVETCGVCHTDIHAAHGDWPVKPTPPFVPGHEGVGLVERSRAGSQRLCTKETGWPSLVGLGLRRLRVLRFGTRDALPEPADDRLHRRWRLRRIRAGQRLLRRPGTRRRRPPRRRPLTCAGVTTYKAVKVSGARSSDLVAIFGIGGLGHLALQYARIAGARSPPSIWSTANWTWPETLGAEHTVNAAIDDPVEAIQALGGADVAIAGGRVAGRVRTGLPQPQTWRHAGIRALPADNYMHLPIFETVLQGITVVGSIVGTRVDLAETFQLHAEGRTQSCARPASSSRSTTPSSRSRKAQSTPAWSSTCAANRSSVRGISLDDPSC